MTDIELYNTRTREKARFAPRDPARIGVYVCGPTVYDRAHIGNARPVVVFDVLVRLLRHVYGPDAVTYVRNITDIDDKINARAAKARAPGESVLDAVHRITAETTAWFHEDMAALGAAPPDHEPRATGHVGQMIAMIERLIAKGHAYAAEGHVLFAVESFEAYGELARRSLDEMRAGARVEVAPYKRDPMDFVLWKPSAADEPGWESPWGTGRPGWHIECSAMAAALLGESFDIHGGGIDLAFPHHENELAQSRCAHGTELMADVWMHNGYLMVEGEKMSKSLGNFITVKDLRDQGIPGEVIRYALLATHYRQPLDWTEKRIEDATRVINRWRRALDSARESAGHEADGAAQSKMVLGGLADDLNSWNALRGIDIQAKRVLEPEVPAHLKDASLKFLNGLDLLGFGAIDSADDLERQALIGVSLEAETRVRTLIEARIAAREARDFARADAIRDGLVAAGVEVMDTPEGTQTRITPGFDPAKLDDLEALQ